MLKTDVAETLHAEDMRVVWAPPTTLVALARRDFAAAAGWAEIPRRERGRSDDRRSKGFRQGGARVAGRRRLLQKYGCSAPRFAGAPDALYERHLKSDKSSSFESSDARERYEAAARAARDVLSDRWSRADETYARKNRKRVYYVSIEFLIGRSLANNIMNLVLDPLVEQTFDEKGPLWTELLDEEPDAGLGNGGLGRLAACFLDSMATLQLPAMGYGLRYEHGMFHQSFRDGWQEERPDNWLDRPDPWEVVRPSESVEVRFGCSFELRDGDLRLIPQLPSTLIGVPYDRPVVGYGGHTINTLRLWRGTAAHAFDFQEFSGGDFVAAMAEGLAAGLPTQVLYPNDATLRGRGLRLVQEYFLVACSLADLVRRFRASNTDWRTLPDKAAIQLNDTHPSLAVPELMRILLDEAHLGWDEAWDLTQRTLAYTNHTLLPEALERWPVEWLEILVPRQLEIILEINRRLLDDLRARFPGDEGRAVRASLIEEGPLKSVRMANLAIVGSHSTNGVAAIHSELLRTTTVRDLAETFPERFNNKTNGVTPRRWLKLCNPPLAKTITAAIGDFWVTDLGALKELRAARRRRRVSRGRPQGQTRRQGAACRVAQGPFGCHRRSRHDLRLPDQAHPRIQAAIAERAEDRGSLSAPPREPESLHAPADLHLRRQGSARLPTGQSHHQAHQQSGSDARRGSRNSRQAEGRVPAGIQRVARRAGHSRRRRLEPDFHRRL